MKNNTYGQKKWVHYLSSCTLCPRRCGGNRLHNERGYCKTGRWAQVASSCVHHGEEPPISGTKGSGTIFFSHCNLACVFCQNYQISQGDDGEEMTAEQLAAVMLELQKRGCHNINFVSPSHVIIQILEAVAIARTSGLTVPLVYNSNGYDSLEALRLLDGVIDIYLPDLKYADDTIARDLSGCPDYWETATAAICEMFRQGGPLVTKNGVATRGVLVRHLVLPELLSGSHKVLQFLASLSKDIGVSIMAQYHPCHRAAADRRIARRLRADEYEQVLSGAHECGLMNAYCQELESAELFLPDFKKNEPFETR